MFCKNCGKELKDDAKFCSVCGTATETAATPTPAPSQESARISSASNNIAIVGFSLSMSSALFWFLAIFILGLPFTVISLGLSIAGIACSAKGINLSASVGDKNKGLAIAGLVVGILSAVIAFILMIVAIVTLVRLSALY